MQREKPSEIFEGENSPLRKAYEEAVQRENKPSISFTGDTRPEMYQTTDGISIKNYGEDIKRESKWQDRFRDKFGEHILKVELHDESLNELISYSSIDNEIISFIQSEIDTARAEEKERIIHDIRSDREDFDNDATASYIISEIILKDI